MYAFFGALCILRREISINKRPQQQSPWGAFIQLHKPNIVWGEAGNKGQKASLFSPAEGYWISLSKRSKNTSKIIRRKVPPSKLSAELEHMTEIDPRYHRTQLLANVNFCLLNFWTTWKLRKFICIDFELFSSESNRISMKTHLKKVESVLLL